MVPLDEQRARLSTKRGGSAELQLRKVRERRVCGALGISLFWGAAQSADVVRVWRRNHRGGAGCEAVMSPLS